MIFSHLPETIKYLCLGNQEGWPEEIDLNIQQKPNQSFLDAIRQILDGGSTGSCHSETLYIEKK